MDKRPLVSVIMPAYKQAAYVREAVDSVINQTYDNWELIVVDDGSPDNVAEIMKEYVDKDKRIKFYHTENHGVSAARNFAVSQSKGEFILPLDADDFIKETYLQKGVERFLSHPETDLVYAEWEMFGNNAKTWKIQYKGYKELLLANSIFNSSIYRRKDFDRIGGYDENFLTASEDWEFAIRLLGPSSVVYQIPEKLYYHREREGSRNAGALDSYESQHQIYQKHSHLYIEYYGYPIKQYIEVSRYRKKYYNIWFKKLWYKYIVKKHLENY